MAAHAKPISPPADSTADQRIVLHGIDWKSYLLVRDAIDSPGVRMTYDRGALEIMSPSPEHESNKKTFARLLETWALERDVPLQGYGSTTFRREAKERGLEPDECYCLGEPLRDYPDLAIEIVHTAGGIEKLPIYQSLAIREVWFLERGALGVHVLGASREYERRTQSALLPELDLDEMLGHMLLPTQHDAVRAYQKLLRTRG